MFDLPGVFGTLADLTVIIVGFGAIIFIHELGHFLAAKWAGIRVLAFSIGMGPVLCSYRKGIGLRRGSTEGVYREHVAKVRGDGAGGDGARGDRVEEIETGGDGVEAAGVRNLNGEVLSPTEYRFSALPLGGYVKMLGQEDINPGAISDASDSYQKCPVWKRMVVISAGVAMNLVTAALLFIVVFSVGLRVQPPVVGRVADGSPAALATPVDRADLGPGLLPEDVILEVNGRIMRALNEVSTEVAMGGLHKPVRLLVDRPGLDAPVVFEASAVKDESTGLLDLGIGPAISTTLAAWEEVELRERFAQIVGLTGVGPGDRLVEVAGQPVRRPQALLDAARDSGGVPFGAVFETGAGEQKRVIVTPERAFQTGTGSVAGEPTTVEHLLGLRGLLRVDPASLPEQAQQGLRPGDVLVRVGERDYPAMAEAMALIRAARGGPLTIEVLRTGDTDKSGDGGDSGNAERVTLEVEVARNGTVGFYPASTAGALAMVGSPTPIAPPGDDEDRSGDAGDENGPEAAAEPQPVRTAAADLIDRAGTRILRVGDRAVSSLQAVAGALIDETADAFEAGAGSFVVPMTVALPLPTQADGREPVEVRDWVLTRADVAAVRDLEWTVPGDERALMMLFEIEQTIDKAQGPIAAVGRGVAKSRQIMNQTYLTFLRLFQGTVRVEHLKGPVGIAHLGTQVADQGFIWVLFFLGLVSVNLAVINFLPLPIVDGGQFLMLAYEGLRRKPVPVAFQNAATLVGLALIGTLFLVVTFHDIRALLGV